MRFNLRKFFLFFSSYLFFRKNPCVLIFLALSFCLIRCSYFFDMGNQQGVISYGSDFGSCVSRVNGVLGSYFDFSGDSVPPTKSDLDAFKVCYQSSIDSFVRYTKSGRFRLNEYSAENVFSFFSRTYPDLNLSLESVEYYLSLKHFLIGGSPNTITKAELLHVRDLFILFTEYLKSLLPYHAVLFDKADLERSKDGYDKFQDTFRVLSQGLNPLLRAMGESSEDRQIDLRQSVCFFIREFGGDRKGVDPNEDRTGFCPIDQDKGLYRHLDFIIASKNLLVESSGDEWSRRNFDRLIYQAFLGYKAVMQFEYFVKDDNLFKDFDSVMHFIPRILSDSYQLDALKNEILLDSISDIMSLGEEVLSHTIESNPHRRLSSHRIEDVLEGLKKSGFYEDDENNEGGIRIEVMIRFFNRFSAKWLGPSFDEDDRVFADKDGNDVGLTRKRLSYAKDMYQKWLDDQRGLNKLFSAKERVSLARDDFESVFDEETVNTLDNAFVQSLEGWAGFFNQVSVHQWGDYGVFFAKDLGDFDYRELTVNHSILWLIELFMKPYNSLEFNRDDPDFGFSERDIYDYYVDEQESQEVYEVLRILGVEAKFMDSRSYESGKSSFAEGNLFGTQGKNDESFDFYEAYEHLSIYLSAYQLSEEFYRRFSDEKSECLMDYKDVYGKYVLENNCLLDYLVLNFSDFFSHLEVVNDFWKSTSEQREVRQKFLEGLEYVSRGGVLNENDYSQANIQNMVASLYYLESLFFLFDENRDGVVQGDELRRVGSHFSKTIKEFLKIEDALGRVDNSTEYFCRYEGSDEKRLENCLVPIAFIFLLKEGDLPKDVEVSFKLLKENLLSLVTQGKLTLEGKMALKIWFRRPLGELLIDDSVTNQELNFQMYENTRADLLSALGVFSYMTREGYDSRKNRMKEFLSEHRNTLFDELSSGEPPNCGSSEDQENSRKGKFCEFSKRLAYCNEDGVPKLYEWMSDYRYDFFPERRKNRSGDDWSEGRKKQEACETMKEISYRIESHKGIFVHCFFPSVGKKGQELTCEQEEEENRIEEEKVRENSDRKSNPHPLFSRTVTVPESSF